MLRKKILDIFTFERIVVAMGVFLTFSADFSFVVKCEVVRSAKLSIQ